MATSKLTFNSARTGRWVRTGRAAHSMLERRGTERVQSFKRWLWRVTLRCLRTAVWKADEWIYAQEQKLQALATSHSPLATDPEFDPEASRARERKQKAKRFPRLRYSQGAWVRQ